jgi:hypothetical protein
MIAAVGTSDGTRRIVLYDPFPREGKQISSFQGSKSCSETAQAVACRKDGRALGTTMTDALARTPWHLWLVGVIAVLFNAIGVFDFVMGMAQGADYMASAGMTPDQIGHYQEMPIWMTIVWAVGVFGAFLASFFLLLRRKLALPVFVLSLAAFLVSLLYTYVLTDGGVVMGPQMAITSAIITGLLVFFIWYSRFMAARHVLR